jgi:hypothetical protein
VTNTFSDGQSTGANLSFQVLCSINAQTCAIATVAVSQLEGDFAQNPDGSVSIYQQQPSQISYLTPGAPETGIAAAIRQNAASSATPLPITGRVPTDYATAPPNLPENDEVLAEFISLIESLVTNIPSCNAYLEEGRGVAGNLGNPRNPAFFQVQTYCEDGASIAPGSIETEWQGEGYNGGSHTGFVMQSCAAAGSTSQPPILLKCFTPVVLVPLAFGHAEINEPISLIYSMKIGPFTIPYRGGSLRNTKSFYLNNKSVTYPFVTMPPSLPDNKLWGPRSNLVDNAVRPPINPMYIKTNTVCDGGTPSTILGKALKDADYKLPAVGFEAHHIKPSCWGGNNEITNGVWLPKNAVGFPNLHSNFTTWFIPDANFTP